MFRAYDSCELIIALNLLINLKQKFNKTFFLTIRNPSLSSVSERASKGYEDIVQFLIQGNVEVSYWLFPLPFML